MKFAVGMHQHQGAREYQQDVMSIKNFGSIGVLGILADGMGGYQGGEIASGIVAENFREFVIEGEDIGKSLKKYLYQGNSAMSEYKTQHPEVDKMGTTAIAFFMTEKSCQWVSVGDSPLYIIRNRSAITRINENHSVGGLLDIQVKKGEITREEALANTQRHMLISAVSGDDISKIDLSPSWSLNPGDIFILASDGIETISPERIREIVLGHTASGVTQENLQNACEGLVNEVISKNLRNQDNVTVILLAIADAEKPTRKMEKKIKIPLWAIGLIGVIAAAAIYLLIPFIGGDTKPLESNMTKVHTPVSKPKNNQPHTQINTHNVSKPIESNTTKPDAKIAKTMQSVDNNHSQPMDNCTSK
jgi:serine/threonine protein phosphatase PrpC